MTIVAILLPNLTGGGAERVALNLADEFIERGIAVDLVLMSASGELLPTLRPEISVVVLNASRMRGVLRPLTRYLRTRQPAALLACMWPLSTLGVAARMLARVSTRVIVAEHTNWSAAEIQRQPVHRLVLRLSMRALLPRASGVVAVSNGAAQDLARLAMLPMSAMTTIYNPITKPESAKPSAPPLTPASWCADGHKRVLAVGRLKAIKEYPVLLRAFAKLRERMEVRLLILGEGGERAELERMAKELGVADHVDMPGFVADTAPYFDRADLHVLCSRGEGFGNVIVEALQQGTPVVSTDCPSGPREILADGRYGTLVPVGDSDALADAMEEALTTKHDLAALRARARDFSVDEAADAYLDLLLPGWRAPAKP